MFLTSERKEEIKRAIMQNFDKVMVCDITEVLEELSAEVRVKARSAAAKLNGSQPHFAQHAEPKMPGSTSGESA